MAPTQTKADSKQKARRQESTEQSDNRVAKRPARGFHRFRNGVMNVSPKGAEKELVKNNQNSPLLRLPAELRRQIWEYVLGYKLLMLAYVKRGQTNAQRVVAPRAERTHGTDLLRTCRQIYSEAALLPYRLNTFAFAYYEYRRIYHLFKPLRQYQRANITHIQLCASKHHGICIAKIQPNDTRVTISMFNLDFLPALKQVLVIITEAYSSSEADRAKNEVEQQLTALLAGSRNVEILFTFTNLTWCEYFAAWTPTEKALMSFD